jgi:hypothetical protein
VADIDELSEVSGRGHEGDRVTLLSAVGAGQVSLDVFDQATWWVDRSGSVHRISTMSRAYLDNVIDHMIHHRERYFVARVALAIDELVDSMTRLEMHPDLLAAEAGAPTWADITPDSWIKSTELMRSLRAHARSRRGPVGP